MLKDIIFTMTLYNVNSFHTLTSNHLLSMNSKGIGYLIQLTDANQIFSGRQKYNMNNIIVIFFIKFSYN